MIYTIIIYDQAFSTRVNPSSRSEISSTRSHRISDDRPTADRISPHEDFTRNPACASDRDRSFWRGVDYSQWRLVRPPPPGRSVVYGRCLMNKGPCFPNVRREFEPNGDTFGGTVSGVSRSIRRSDVRESYRHPPPLYRGLSVLATTTV